MTLLLVLLAILAIVFIGLGFVVKWLFILAVIAALVFLISLFFGGARRGARGTY
ncbi:MAG TPA: hypothetical protein VH281_03610 [Gaiellaceae bacterium]|jgi:hypothetical protein